MKEELFELNKALLTEVEKLASGIKIDKSKKEDIFLLFSFVKAYRTVNSIILLCKEGNGQDAFMLLRTLFELMVITKYIFLKNVDERIRLYYSYDWVLRDKMLRALKESPNREEVYKGVTEQSGSQLNEIADKAKAHKLRYAKKGRDTWSNKSVWEMADATGLGGLYKSLYKLGSQLIHSASRCENEYLKLIDGELELITYPSDTYVSESLVGSFQCLLEIVKELDNQLKLEIGDNLEKLERKGIKIIDSISI